jgi:VWFA-related protein
MVLLAFLFAGGSLAWPGSRPSQQPAEQTIRFAVSVDTVTLDVVVVDKKGRFVPGLVSENFEILEDGLPQSLSFFTAQFTPVTTLLLLDTSASIRSSLTAIQTAAYLFAQNLSEGDRTRIGLFSNEIHFGASFTDSMEEHLSMLKSMKAAGTTALYDAILAALDEFKSVEGRKSLLVFTDGDDSGPAKQGSRAIEEDALEAAKEADVTIYTVGFAGWGPEGSECRPGSEFGRWQCVNRPFLSALAEATGGRAFFPEKDVEEVKKAFAEVQQGLHRHYRMAYVPTRETSRDAPWRNIEIKLKGKIKGRQGLVVRTRQGYYARTGPSE